MIIFSRCYNKSIIRVSFKLKPCRSYFSAASLCAKHKILEEEVTQICEPSRLYPKIQVVVKWAGHEKSFTVPEPPVIHCSQRKCVFYSEQRKSLSDGESVVLDVDDIVKNDSMLLASSPAYKDIDEDAKNCSLSGALQPDALDWNEQRVLLKNLPSIYASLAKSRLTGLVVLTAIIGYAIAPGSLDACTLALCATGTALTSCSANTFNQFLEVPYDSQMNRTKNRVLVKGLVSSVHAVSFAIVCAATGVAVLYFGVNGITAFLGTFNLFLYTLVYTPMKRISIANTWVGSVVGAIPPVMGWTGCTGCLDPGAWILAGILFAWQFPHFNSLSWNLRPDYSQAGYRMMCVTNPGLCRSSALLYSSSVFMLSFFAPLLNVTTWTFTVDSLPLNCYLTYLAWKFYKDADSNSSRKLFRFSLVYLPAVLMLMLISKKYEKPKKER